MGGGGGSGSRRNKDKNIMLYVDGLQPMGKTVEELQKTYANRTISDDICMEFGI